MLVKVFFGANVGLDGLPVIIKVDIDQMNLSAREDF